MIIATENFAHWIVDNSPNQCTSKQMTTASQIRMDECTKTIVNEDVKETIGDILCDQIDFFYDRGYFNTDTAPDRFGNIEMTFQYSVCGAPWRQIANNVTTNGITTSTPLGAPEALCCIRQNGKLKFRRCNGDPFNTICN